MLKGDVSEVFSTMVLRTAGQSGLEQTAPVWCLFFLRRLLSAVPFKCYQIRDDFIGICFVL